MYNTLGRRTEPFAPREPGRVSIYVCGPTVQSPPHLGHGRSAVAFDVIRRYLAWCGYQVEFVRNITDVEDKIIAAAAESGETTDALATRMSARFADGYDRLGVLLPDFEPRATEHIPEMVELIARLIDRGLAYPAGSDTGSDAGSDDVYFSVRALEGYGRLSGRNPDELRAGARVEVSEQKRDPLDFALWKAAKPGEPWWESPWGPGRPGWHIECSAMATRYLGHGFDIHGGGSDLIFPHHENEIAQSEGGSGLAFARYWLHNGMVNLGGEKMAKSTGHLIDLAEAIEGYGGLAVRLFYLRAHYRSPLEFSPELMADAAASLDRINRLLERASAGSGLADEGVLKRFAAAMNDDFGTPEALGVIFETVRDANRALDAGQESAGFVAAVREMTEVLGLVGPGAADRKDSADLAEELAGLAGELGLETGGDPEELIERLVGRRARARTERDFALSDSIRDKLSAWGVLLEDVADGTRWLRR